MRDINEIVEDIEKQLGWRGPNGKTQGIITLPREDMIQLMRYAKASHEYAREARPKQ